MNRPRFWRRGREDETVLVGLLAGLIAAAGIVLAMDLAELRAADARRGPAETAVPGDSARPFLPTTRPQGPDPRPGPARTEAERLAAAMTFELVADGRLMLTGAIVPGSAGRLAAELDKRGGYVETVVLDSPGGALDDALAMARLIRESGLDTEVPAGGYCASSCPLLLAGGVERRASRSAGIGVHQVFAVGREGAADIGMAEAQRVSASCQRFLVEMGVDPRVWMHAMETPADSLFYFTPEEMAELKLATELLAEEPAGA